MSLLPALLFLQLAAPQSAGTHKLAIQEYAFDSGHCIVEFSVGFALIRVKGRFPQTHGTILYDPAAPERSSVSVVIETKSLDTGWPHRDDHLRTDDFFDVEKYPTITFQSERLERTAGGWVATGPFTMHGVTKQVAIPFHFIAPPTRSAESRSMILDLAGGLRLSRSKFGSLGAGKHKSWFTTARNATVPDSVDDSFEIEGWLVDAVSERPPQLDPVLERIRTVGAGAQLDRWQQARGSKTDAEFTPYFHGGDLVVRALVADGRIADAVTMSRGLTQLFPSLASAWLVNGFALDASGDTRAAEQSYARAREVFRPPVVDPNEKFPQVDEFWYYDD